MGIFGGLFGRSGRKDDVAGDRCNDCGMAGGTHTDWCPTASPEGAGEAEPARIPEHDTDDSNHEPTVQA